jgi:hypothetical protein
VALVVEIKCDQIVLRDFVFGCHGSLGICIPTI